ncbi:hypothetical protein LNTAR_22469 [Lentisphaera araneosa HTCC2155]|uniref:Uncharacterized protein n=1 Tax=Lentisphaera araneosa HTCC2155 TaxID=313628 RepID=A6DG85_9BACT|nr:hypothetical protein LNTAR_22469 [Lentisphaera araneosa HTCC2155]
MAKACQLNLRPSQNKIDGKTKKPHDYDFSTEKSLEAIMTSLGRWKLHITPSLPPYRPCG